MQTRTIGPFQVSALGFGCMSLSHAYGTPPSPHEAATVLRAADASLDADALNTEARIDVHVAAVMLERALGRVPDGQP